MFNSEIFECNMTADEIIEQRKSSDITVFKFLMRQNNRFEVVDSCLLESVDPIGFKGRGFHDVEAYNKAFLLEEFDIKH